VLVNTRLQLAQIGPLLDDTRIRAASLTGSTRAGRSLAAAAGSRLKKCVLELGGSDPFIVLADADLEKAAQAAVTSRFNNAGQTCIAAKRWIVEAPVYEQFRSLVVRAMEQYAPGDPLEVGVRLGPMARPDLLHELNQQVTRSLALGATATVPGGLHPNHPGNFFLPTLLENVSSGMPAYDEELFGPVAVLLSATDAADAIRIANDTPYGLGATLWTSDAARASQLAQQLDTGNVAINGPVQSDPRLPFGGTKASGYGRELSAYGMKEFMNIKTTTYW
jgi:succinate-semialdehyde dehydrogenase/glutarate-semialdehyde dehydrogenase